MLTQNRYLAPDDFLNKLSDSSRTGHEISQLLLAEIERMESLKISLVDEEMGKNSESVVMIVNDIDSYIFVLQDVVAGLQADAYSREVLSSDRVTEIRDQILRILKQDRKL